MKNSYLLCGIFLLLPVFGYAQQIRITVVNECTKQPITHAEIVFDYSGASLKREMTDDGEYIIDLTANFAQVNHGSSFRYKIIAANYKAFKGSINIPNNNGESTASEQLTPKPIIIEGKVIATDTDNKGLSAVDVSLRHTTYSEKTNNKGFFSYEIKPCDIRSKIILLFEKENYKDTNYELTIDLAKKDYSEPIDIGDVLMYPHTDRGGGDIIKIKTYLNSKKNKKRSSEELQTIIIVPEKGNRLLRPENGQKNQLNGNNFEFTPKNLKSELVEIMLYKDFNSTKRKDCIPKVFPIKTNNGKRIELKKNRLINQPKFIFGGALVLFAGFSGIQFQRLENKYSEHPIKIECREQAEIWGNLGIGFGIVSACAIGVNFFIPSVKYSHLRHKIRK